MIPANTDVECPVCDEEFNITKDTYDGETVVCDNCDASLVLVDGDLEEVEEDIFEEEEQEEPYDDRKGDRGIKHRD